MPRRKHRLFVAQELEQPAHYTLSKIGCWLALDRAVSLAGIGQLDNQRSSICSDARDRIRDWIETECRSEAKQAYVLHAGSQRLDAGLLLAVRFGFPNAVRLAATRDAVQRELAVGPHVPLFRHAGGGRRFHRLWLLDGGGVCVAG